MLSTTFTCLACCDEYTMLRYPGAISQEYVVCQVCCVKAREQGSSVYRGMYARESELVEKPPQRKAPSLADIMPGAALPKSALDNLSYMNTQEEREDAKDARIRELEDDNAILKKNAQLQETLNQASIACKALDDGVAMMQGRDAALVRVKELEAELERLRNANRRLGLADAKALNEIKCIVKNLESL